MIEERLCFSDPLYETISLDWDVPSRLTAFTRDPDVTASGATPAEIVQTADFARLAHLRQAGLAWLVFPSATHTRFSHSIGTWWLGRIAEDRVRVTVPTSKNPVPFGTWLNDTGLRREYYLALLLHDVGHGPLSHVLENHEGFMNQLKSIGMDNPEHEQRGVGLLRGSGPLFKAWKRIAAERYGRDRRVLGEVLVKPTDNANQLDLSAIAYLIAGDDRFLRESRCPDKRTLPIIKEFVSGLLDLDRLDHTARDSYFSGLRQLGVNVTGLLSNLVLDPRIESESGTRWYLTGEGVGHAASVLFGRRQLFTTMFHTWRFLSLSAMMHRALTDHLDTFRSSATRAEEMLRILLMEDEEFLSYLSASENSSSAFLATSVRAANPYAFVGRWERDRISELETAVKDLTEYSEREYRGGIPQVVLSFDRGFNKTQSLRRYRDLLEAEAFTIAGTEIPITSHPDYEADFAHLYAATQAKYVWVFAKAHGDELTSVKRHIEKILRPVTA